MSLGRRLVWAFMPAQRYLDARSPFRGAPPSAGSSGPMPYVALDGPPPTPEELDSWRADIAEDDEGRTCDDEAEASRHDDQVRLWTPLARTLAAELVRTGTLRHEADGRVLVARLVRFWRGPSVLDATCTRGGETVGRATTVRRGRPESVADEITPQLADLLAW